MITASIKQRGADGSLGRRTVRYVVIGTDADSEMTDAEALAAIAGPGGAAPNEIDDGLGGLLYAKDASLDELIQTPTQTIAIVSAEYGPAEAPSQLDEGGTEPQASASYEFAYQAPSAHIFYALNTTAYGTDPPDFGNKIRCKYDGQDLVHEGIDTPAANTTNIWRLTVPKGFVTSAYESLVESLMGSVNSESFKGRPAGTMRFVQCQSSVSTGGTLNISWGFQYVPNETNKTIGGITGVDIGGHQIWWTFDERSADLTAKKVVLEPRAVYVQDIFNAADLNDLGF